MKKNENSKGIENLNEVATIDATTTKSSKKGGKKESANEEQKFTKSDLFGCLRSLFDLDILTYSEKLKTLCTDFVSGKISAIEFDRLRAETKKQCVPPEITSIDDFLNRKGVKVLLNKICDLYGTTFDKILDIIVVREPEGLPSIKIYSKDQNDNCTLTMENNLFFRLDDLSASTFIAGIAGAGVFLNSIRVAANKKANDRKQSFKAIDELLKRGVIDATKAEELKNLVC